jgi:acyl-coenzyme A synthetase/AMP-(fatty) acid ligase
MTLPILNIDTIDFENGLIKEEFLLNRLSKLIDTDPYCIINTSGSTGTPKGVVLNHKSFVDFIEWSVDTFKFSEDEIIGSLSPLVFDIYSYELCMLMSKGSTIVLIPDSLAAFPIKILEILVKEKITFLFWVPTIMVNIANMGLLEKIHLPSLKTVWFAGEVFPTKQFNYWKNNLKDCLFANLYGPIEITLDCTYFIIDRDIPDDEPLPIGIACRNTDILILNEEDKLVEKGEEGELCVRGTSLAMGYFNNPEKTALAFVQNPLNNSYPEIIYRTGDVVLVNERDEIVFKGRKDSLVKHLGYRIELGEIEHVIVNTLKIAKNGCVVYNSIKKEITLFYEASNEISVAEFRKELTKSLPKYMIPTVYIFMQELPRNTNGKIDRLYLKNIVN